MKSIVEASSEKSIARKMQKKGYNYILLVKGHDPLYAKEIKHANELMRTDLKDYRVDIKKISKKNGYPPLY